MPPIHLEKLGDLGVRQTQAPLSEVDRQGEQQQFMSRRDPEAQKFDGYADETDAVAIHEPAPLRTARTRRRS